MRRYKKFLYTFAFMALISASYGNQADKEALLSRPHSFETKNLIIAPTYEEDIDRIYEMRYDHYAHKYRADPKGFQKNCHYHPKNSKYHSQKKEYRDQIKAYQEKEAHEKTKFTDYSLFLKEAGEINFLGHYKLTIGSSYVRCREEEPFIDIMLSVSQRGKGYGTEAQHAITKNVIKALIDLREWKRFNAEILVENENSWKLHEKCGWRSYESEKPWGIEYYIYQYPPETGEDGESKIRESNHIHIKKLQKLAEEAYRPTPSKQSNSSAPLDIEKLRAELRIDRGGPKKAVKD